MNAKHTQGQWSWYEHGKTDTSPVKVETKDQVIAEVVYKTDHEEHFLFLRRYQREFAGFFGVPVETLLKH